MASSMPKQHLERAGLAFLPPGHQSGPRQQWDSGQWLQHPEAAPIHGDDRGCQALCQHGQHRAWPETMTSPSPAAPSCARDIPATAATTNSS